MSRRRRGTDARVYTEVAVVAELVPIPVSPKDLLRVERFYPFEEGDKRLLFVVDSAAFCELDEAGWMLAQQISGEGRVKKSDVHAALAERFGAEEADATLEGFEQLEVLVPFDRPTFQRHRADLPLDPVQSLVLHVSHDCNMRCGYCYADYGRYGDDFGYMDPKLAVEHTKKFFDQLGDTRSVSLTFFGGEPLMNMDVVYAAHAYAKQRAAEEGRKIGFGLTTNGTLLTKELVDWFDREGFTITVSIDGPPDVNDRLRPIQDGTKSYDVIMSKVHESGVRASARVTLTKKCLDVARIVRHLVGAGFKDVGVSPVATGNGKFDLDGPDLERLLAELHLLSDDFVEWAKQGKIFPFSNIRTVVEQIAAGDARPVPCGAGTKLVAADNKGDLYACHRLVGQEQFKMGHVDTGIDPALRSQILDGMHPRSRAPCESCWARYLCGGGCHHIAWLHSSSGAAPWTISNDFCDFLRGWYRLGLYTYARVMDEAPEVMARLRGQATTTGCNQPQGQ